MAFDVVDVQPTPNPSAMKFVLDRVVTMEPISFFDSASAESHPLARHLFAIGGVESVLLLNDFVTVNKTCSGRWVDIKTKVRRILATDF